MPETTHAGSAPRHPSPVSPYDAQADPVDLLARLRASSGATRVSVRAHEATTELVVPFRQAPSERVLG